MEDSLLEISAHVKQCKEDLQRELENKADEMYQCSKPSSKVRQYKFKVNIRMILYD
jgi:hypothetical protein